MSVVNRWAAARRFILAAGLVAGALILAQAAPRLPRWTELAPTDLQPVAHEGAAALAFHDDHTLLTADLSGSLYAWDLATGARRRESLITRGLILSRDTRRLEFAGRGLLAVGEDHVTWLDLQGSRLAWQVPALADAALSPAGDLLAGLESDGRTLRVYQLEGPRTLRYRKRLDRSALLQNGYVWLPPIDPSRRRRRFRQVVTGRRPRVLAVHPSGRMLVETGPVHRLQRLWVQDLVRGTTAALPESDFRETPATHFSPDGKWLLAVGDLAAVGAGVERGKAVRIWRVPGPAQAWSAPVYRGGLPVAAVPGALARFAPTGTRVALAGDDGSPPLGEGLPLFLDWRTARRLPGATGSHRGPVRDGAWSPDGRRLATLGMDGRVAFWDGETGMLTGYLKERR